MQVIYALNTKNDEHDTVLQALKEGHEEEMQQLLAETKEKIAQYKNKIDSEQDNKKRIDSLAQCIAEYEKQKKNALSEFENFKKKSEEREIQLKTEHSQKILSMSQEVIEVKSNFEDRLKYYENMKKRLEEDKNITIDELKKAHRKEVEHLIHAQQSQFVDMSKYTELEQKYSQEIQDLKNKCEELENDRTKLSEEHEGKLSKAQSFYENELQALKNAQNNSNEERLQTLQEKYDNLKKDLTFQEKEHKQRVDGLVEQLVLSEEEQSKLQAQLQQQEVALKNKTEESKVLDKQVSGHQSC